MKSARFTTYSFSLEALSEFGGSAAFGFAEEAVEMAEGVKAAGEADFGDRQLGGQQHSRSDAQTIVDDVAVRRAACLIAEET